MIFDPSFLYIESGFVKSTKPNASDSTHTERFGEEGPLVVCMARTGLTPVLEGQRDDFGSKSVKDVEPGEPGAFIEFRSSSMLTRMLAATSEARLVVGPARIFLRCVISRTVNPLRQGESWHLAFSVSPQIRQSLPLGGS